ncbi:MAG: porin family protein [Bacteroidota bacterium]
MKKLILILLVFGAFSTLNAQFLNYGIKGGLNYNSNGNLRDVSGFQEDLKIRSKEQTGYHFGVFSEIKLPLWIYLRPELLYTHTKSSYKDDSYKSELTINKIDVPVLAGVRILKIGRVFAGPVFTYMLDTDFKSTDIYDNVKNLSSDDFGVAAQLGAGIVLGQFGADIRWETGFTDTEAQFIGDLTGGYIDSSNEATIRIDTRPQQFILSFFYQFR